MLDVTNAIQDDSIIRKINRELADSVNKIQEEINSRNTLEAQLSQKKLDLQELQNNYDMMLESIRKTKDEYDSLKYKEKWMRNVYQELTELKNYLKSKVAEYGPAPKNLPPISQQAEQEIRSYLEQIFANIEHEMRPADLDELKKELNQVLTERKKVEKEIQILKQLTNGDWDPHSLNSITTDTLLRDFDEMNLMCPSNPLKINLKLDIPSPTLLEQPLDAKPPSMEKTLEAEKQLRDYLEETKNVSNTVNEGFQEQIKFLHRLQATQEQKQSQKSTSAEEEENLFSEFHEQADASELPVLEINANSDKQTDPAAALLMDFSQYYEEMTEKLPKTDIFSKVVEEAEKSLNIDPEVHLAEPTVVYQTVVSDELTKLSSQLTSLTEAVDSIPTQPLSFDIPTLKTEYSSKMEVEEIEVPPLDDSAANRLAEIAKTKLPYSIAKAFQSIPEKHVEEEPDAIEEEDEIISEDTEERIEKFASILRDVSAIDFDPSAAVTNGVVVHTTEVLVEPLNRESILEAVDLFLSPGLQTQAALDAECCALSERLSALRAALGDTPAAEGPTDDELVAARKRAEAMEREAARIEQENEQKMVTLRNLNARLGDCQREEDRLKAQVKSSPKKPLAKLIAEVDAAKQHLKEKKRQLEELKK